MGSCALYGLLIVRMRLRIAGQTYYVLFDDAMISMRYARNLAHGLGLLWNPGLPPVEGYTNLLWTLWMAVPHLLGVPEAKDSLFVILSGAGILLANLYFVWRIAGRLAPGSTFVPALAVGLVALSNPVVMWTLRGMEVGLMALAIDWSIWRALRLEEDWRWRHALALAAGLAALILVRPDGLLPAAVIGVYAVWRSPRIRRRATAGLVLPAVAGVVALHMGFEAWYYGSALPNTYYLKLAGISLRARVTRGVESLGGQLAIFLWPAVLAAALNARRLLEPRRALLLVVVAVKCCYAMYVGGDAWDQSWFASRYVAVSVPVLLLLAAAGLGEVFEWRAAHGRSAMLALAAAAAGILLVEALPFGVELRLHNGLWSRYPLTTDAATALGCVAVAAVGICALAASGAQSRRWVASGLLPAPALAGRAGAVVLLAALTIPNLGRWRTRDALELGLTSQWAELGLRIRAATDDSATVAVVTAGAIPYLAHRTVVDLLGMNDPVIARERPRGGFLPGHNKWDYGHSIGTLKPDLIAQLYGQTPSDLAYLRATGYEPVAGGMWVRRDSRRVDVPRLERPL